MAEQETLVVVNEHDEVLGQKTRQECHAGGGILHRAITVLLVNAKGELLLTRRSQSKTLWPGWWDTSCSTHVSPGETYEQAGERRLPHELGVRCALKLVTKFLYHAPFDSTGSENELCALLVGECDQPIRANAEEISETRWIPIPRSVEEIESNQEYTPWLMIALKHYATRP